MGSLASKTVGEEHIRMLWHITFGAEIVHRLGLLVVVSSKPYSELSMRPEREWIEFQAPVIVEGKGQDPKIGPQMSGKEAEKLVGQTQQEICKYLTNKLCLERFPEEKGIRVHPKRCFCLTRFFWQPDGSDQYLARVLLNFQRLPLVDAERLLNLQT